MFSIPLKKTKTMKKSIFFSSSRWGEVPKGGWGDASRNPKNN